MTAAAAPRSGRRRKGRGEALMVPEATFSSYYGRQIVKTPTWKMPDVPSYLYLGGMAGASSTMAALAEATGNPALVRTGRVVAAVAATASVGALVHDLGRPTRFLHMLRVFKPTSALSVGSWILAPFSGLTVAAAASELTGYVPVLGRLAGAGAGVLGPAMTTYTAVLLADTAVPAWHEAHRELPFVFAGSALASAGGVGLVVTPAGSAGPARRMAVAGAALEIAATERMHTSVGLARETLEQGRPGALMKIARACTAAGGVAALASRRNRPAAVTAGVLLNVGSLALRFGVFMAGLASVADPKYVVVPQRERIAAREAAAAASG